MASFLAILSTICTGIAPYTSVTYTNYLLWCPLIFVLTCFFGVLWITDIDRFKEMFNEKLKRGNESGGLRPNGGLLLSSLVLIITMLVSLYYWRDFSIVWHATQENIPMRSIQLNGTYFWLNPVF